MAQPPTEEVYSINPDKSLLSSMIRSLTVKSNYLHSSILKDPTVLNDVQILVDNLTDLLKGKKV